MTQYFCACGHNFQDGYIQPDGSVQQVFHKLFRSVYGGDHQYNKCTPLGCLLNWRPSVPTISRDQPTWLEDKKLCILVLTSFFLSVAFDISGNFDLSFLTAIIRANAQEGAFVPEVSSGSILSTTNSMSCCVLTASSIHVCACSSMNNPFAALPTYFLCRHSVVFLWYIEAFI